MKKIVPILALLCAIGTKKAAAQPGRWYSYYEFLNYNWGGAINYGTFDIWNDTTSVYGYTGSSGATYYNNKFTSAGMTFAPRLSAWDNTSTFTNAIITVGPTDVFTIDSVALFGQYLRNLSKPASLRDTLRLAFVYGDGSATSNLPSLSYTHSYLGLVDYLKMFYDVTKNTAGRNASGTGPVPYKQDIILTNTDTATDFAQSYALTTPFTVPAGQIASMSLSFKSGDPTYIAGDTITYASNAHKYGAFHPYVGWHTSTWTGGVDWPTYFYADSNIGQFGRPVPATNYWYGSYIPTWVWVSGGGPSALQYPIIDFHITCPTCRLTGSISYPGSSMMCIGDTQPFSHLTPGGTWSSSNTAVATVSSSGLVTAVSVGTATITYAIGTNVATADVFINDPNPVITGPTTVCAGNTITLSGGAGMTGPWTSSAASIASVSGGMGTAVVTGVAAGTATISLSVWSTICGMAGLGTYTVTVETLPDAGTLSGGDTVCLNATTTITPSITGGTWSTSNANAFVSGGAVSGVAAGLSVVTYTVTNMCGTSNVQKLVNIIVCPTGVSNVTSDAIITVSPNPTSDDINITGTTKINNVAIYDVTGQRVFFGNYGSRNVNVSLKDMPAGIYTVRVNDDKIYRVVRQ